MSQLRICLSGAPFHPRTRTPSQAPLAPLTSSVPPEASRVPRGSFSRLAQSAKRWPSRLAVVVSNTVVAASAAFSFCAPCASR
eukprot:805096-Pyramimonas_sp.AAC.1